MQGSINNVCYAFSDTLVVVAGGSLSKRVGIYSYRDNSFSSGPDLPYSLQYSSSVIFGDSFALIGGVNTETFADSPGAHTYMPLLNAL
jgi:hypothetical protein